MNYAPYVRRRDISYDEVRQYEQEFGMVALTPAHTTWTATLDGNLSTGERVHIERFATTRQEAANALAEEIESQGWGIQ